MITKGVDKNISQINVQLRAIGKEASANITGNTKARSKASLAGTEARLRGAVAASDILRPHGRAAKVGKLLGRLGAPAGLFLLANGIYLRGAVAEGVTDQDTADAICETGSLSAFRGSSLIGERENKIATATPLDAKAVAQIKAGRSFIAAKDTVAFGCKGPAVLVSGKLATAGTKHVLAAEAELLRGAAEIAAKVVPGLKTGVSTDPTQVNPGDPSPGR